MRFRDVAFALSALLCACGPGFRGPRAECSYGSPSRGFLRGSSRIATRGVGYELFRDPSAGGLVHTTARLRRAVTESAARVARIAPGGAALRIGDFSAPFGGHVSRHRSHRNGRDVDLLYYALDTATGESVLAPGFVRYTRDGSARDATATVRLDVARSWMLVESLVQESSYGVVWIFCANWIREQLLSWARAHGRSQRAIERAERVLHQPGDAAPHDDHFHLRIACDALDRAVGCSDGGPSGWWLERQFGKADSAPADGSVIAVVGDVELEEAPIVPVRRRRRR